MLEAPGTSDARKRRKKKRSKSTAPEKHHEFSVHVAQLKKSLEAAERRLEVAQTKHERFQDLVVHTRACGDDSLTSSAALSGVSGEENERIILAGWLTKKGRKVRNWKKRWFVLQGRYLRYYVSSARQEKKGEINIETCLIEELSHREESVRPCMALVVESRKFLFHADTQSENQRWYEMLVCKHEELKYKAQDAGNPGEKLVACNSAISHAACSALAMASQVVEHLTSICLRYAQIDNFGCAQIASSVKKHYSIEVLDLQGNYITALGARALAQAQFGTFSREMCMFVAAQHCPACSQQRQMISGNRVLHTLDISVNDIQDDGVTHIANALPSSVLSNLVLDWNGITPQGASAVLLAMQQTNNFSVISIGDNLIGDTGFARILQVCSLARKIECIRAPRCGITREGIMKLSNMMPSLSVTHLYLSGNAGICDSRAKSNFLRAVARSPHVEYIDLGDIVLDKDALRLLRHSEECDVLSLF